MKIVSLDQLTFAHFASLVRTRFRVGLAPDDWIELELVEAVAPRITATGGAHNRRYENFSLLFLGPASRELAQGTYPFESGSIGRFELFIVPVSRDAEGTRYHVVFSRLIPSA